MTSGDAIAHAERAPRDNTSRLNGVQLWVALPDLNRHTDATFEHPRLSAPSLVGFARPNPVS